MSALFTQAFATPLVIFDPLAAVPVFLTLARHQSPSGQRGTARVPALVAAGIATVFAVAEAIPHRI
ncbi:MarC family protein [Streptosporangium sandarakinum]|uniref:MarC family protein n=1 Tax=Streptosporangium sandarakinum TaxID=1260955 RepID=UPI003419F7C7